MLSTPFALFLFSSGIKKDNNEYLREWSKSGTEIKELSLSLTRAALRRESATVFLLDYDSILQFTVCQMCPSHTSAKIVAKFSKCIL